MISWFACAFVDNFNVAHIQSRIISSVCLLIQVCVCVCVFYSLPVSIMSKGGRISNLSQIVNSIRRVFQAPKPELRGVDRQGNSYYEVNENRLHHGLKTKRYFVPGQGQQWNSPMSPEWETWLRYQREQVPSMEEIIHNEQIAETKKSNAYRLNLQRQQEQSLPQSRQQLKTIKKSESSFPSYPDLEK